MEYEYSREAMGGGVGRLLRDRGGHGGQMSPGALAAYRVLPAHHGGVSHPHPHRLLSIDPL